MNDYDESPSNERNYGDRNPPHPIEVAAFNHATFDWETGEPALSEAPSWHQFPKIYRDAYEARWQHLYMAGADY